jgi:hypothetical protein
MIAEDPRWLLVGAVAIWLLLVVVLEAHTIRHDDE